MMPISRIQIRAIVLLGFLLSAVAGVMNFLNDVTSPGFPFSSFQGVVDSLVNPLTTIAAVCAWSFLMQLRARDEAQLRLLRRAFLFFAAQYLLLAVGLNFIFTPPHSFGGFWITSAIWFEFIGAFASALGLFLMSRSLVRLDEIELPTLDRSIN